jgi:tetratricopeptide (TPR) repeat protein
MEIPMENQAVQQMPATEVKKPLLKRIPKWLIASLVVVVAFALVYSFNDTVKTGTRDVFVKVKDTTTAVFTPAAGSEKDLYKAREAFAAGNVDGAIAAYKEVLARHPGSTDAMGELGNVYFMTGRTGEAAQSYFDAASKSLEENRPEVAQALLPAIGQGNPALAQELQQKLMQSMQPKEAQNATPEKRS